MKLTLKANDINFVLQLPTGPVCASLLCAEPELDKFCTPLQTAALAQPVVKGAPSEDSKLQTEPHLALHVGKPGVHMPQQLPFFRDPRLAVLATHPLQAPAPPVLKKQHSTRDPRSALLSTSVSLEPQVDPSASVLGFQGDVRSSLAPAPADSQHVVAPLPALTTAPSPPSSEHPAPITSESIFISFINRSYYIVLSFSQQ